MKNTYIDRDLKESTFETRDLTLKERIDCNDVQTEFNPRSGTVSTRDTFAHRIKYLRYGLKSLNEVEITETNFDGLVNQLTNDEIIKISDKIAEETNFTKKK